ncbi:hypothetical protein KOI40_15775 [Aestuariicella sp. G3-2]|uniref:alanine-zipper protein n=1 Tax=Pseudomaricurvus albidus TaxID=2842452 RepID=UPI001C0C4AEA|nr:alanine-zipper protein [Aestuariicella albida]MBU3071284.1 hypothetical protein [Aestuariicella albida]
MNTVLKTTTIGLFLTAMAGLTGCAATTKEEIAGMKADIQAATDTANRAASEASAARSEAAAARAAAEETNEKLDRMYKKSMYK